MLDIILTFIICYEVANNAHFSISNWEYAYCPGKTKMATKNEQIHQYIFDSFMALEIPAEFSEEYLNNKEKLK